MLSATSLRSMIPPAGGWPSARRQCRTAATIAKQQGAPYIGHVGCHWFSVHNGDFRKTATAQHSTFCRCTSVMALDRSISATDKATKRIMLDHTRKWRLDAVWCGWRLP